MFSPKPNFPSVSPCLRVIKLAPAIVLVFLSVSCAADHLPDQDLRITATAPAFKMPPDELWKEFNRNPKEAQKQYFGKAIELSGKVVAVKLDEKKNQVVYFSTPTEPGLRARLLESAAEVSKLAGTRVTLRCFCEGLTPDNSVLLKSCIQR